MAIEAEPVVLLRRGEVDLRSGDGSVAGRPVHLTETQRRLLGRLAESPGEPVDRAELERAAGIEGERLVDVAIRRLRTRIELDASRPEVVLSVFNRGYCYVTPSPEETERRGVPGRRDPPIGREPVIDGLLRRLRVGSPITLIGPGGVGKSTVAAEVARRSEHPLTAFVDVEDARGAADVEKAVARALGASPDELPDGRWAMARAISELRARPRALLVLDGAELVADRVAALLGEVSRGAPETRVLVTSRVVLGIEGEVVERLEPLAPDDARALFLARARAVDAAIDPATEGLPELVARLEGLPLAIELAAARARAMSVAAMVQRLRPAELSDPRAELPRHRSLTAALAWSWDLLDPELRRTLGALSVFVGPITDEAAAAVLGDSGPARIRALVDASWLVPTEDRVRWLASTRTFAAERTATDVLADAELRHARYHAALAVRLRGEGHPTPAVLDALDGVLPELLVVGRVADRAPDEVAEVAVALHDRTHTRGGFEAYGFLLDQVLAVLPDDHPRMPTCLRARGSVHRQAERYDEARADLVRAMELATGRTVTSVTCELGTLHLVRGQFDEAERWYERTLAHEPSEDQTALATIGLADAARMRGDPVRAEALFRRALAHAAHIPTNRTIGVRVNWSVLLQQQERLKEAREQLEQALVEIGVVGDGRHAGTAAYNLAVVLAELGEPERALALVTEAARIWTRWGRATHVAHTAIFRAELALDQGCPEDALTALDEAEPGLTPAARPSWLRARIAVAACLPDLPGEDQEARRALDALAEVKLPDLTRALLSALARIAAGDRDERELERLAEAPAGDGPARLLIRVLRRLL